MATFIQGQTERFGEMMLYQPDYNFLAQVLGTKQAQYDKGFAAYKSVQNSALNNPLTNADNQKHREVLFKKIQDSMKVVSGIDLSNPTNVVKATKLFDPIVTDKEIAYDMYVTRKHQQERMRMEEYRNSEDPEKRKYYNDYAAKYLAYGEEELRTAKRGDGSITRVQPREFVLFDDIEGYLNKQAKEQGIEIKFDRSTGDGYIETITNGQTAVVPFTQWAKTQMGNKFDKQLRVMASVQADDMVQQEMMMTGLPKNLAKEEVSKRIAESMTLKLSDESSLIQQKLVDLNRRIDTFSRTYPNGKMPEKYLKYYNELAQEKNAYDGALAENMNQLEMLKERGVEYVSSNLSGMFFNEAKSKTAATWATSKAMATQSFELKSDDVTLKKWDLAQRQREHEDNLREKIRQFDLQYQLDVQKAANEGVAPKDRWGMEALPGIELEGFKTGDEILEASRIKLETEMFNSLYGAGNGAVNLLVNPNDQAKFYPVLKKISDMKTNTSITLTDAEKKTIAEFGKSIGFATIPVPQNSKEAARFFAFVDQQVYKKASGELKHHFKTGNSQKSAQVLKSLNNFITNINTLLNQQAELEANYKRLEQELVDERGELKPFYKEAGVTITGYNKDGTPIYDLTKLSTERRDYLSKVLDPSYTARGSVSNDAFLVKNPTRQELYVIANKDFSNSIVDESGKPVDAKQIFGNMTPAQVKETFGKNYRVDFNAAKGVAYITLYKEPEGTGQNKTAAKSYRMEVPYEKIEEYGAYLPELYKKTQTNKVDVGSLGEFNKFLNNPLAVVQSSSAEDQLFSYEFRGTGLSNGGNAVQATFRFIDPNTNKEQVIDKTINNIDVSGPKSVRKLLDIKEKIYTEYMTKVSNFEQAIKNTEYVPYGR